MPEYIYVNGMKAIVIPPPVYKIDYSIRINQLKGNLKDPVLQHQSQNLRAAIAKYESGDEPTFQDSWWFLNGYYSELPKDNPMNSTVFHEVGVLIYYYCSCTNSTFSFFQYTEYESGYCPS